MPNFLLVMLGGALGSGLRYGIGLAAVRRLGAGFPWGTFIVNLAGAFGAGLLLGFLLSRAHTGEPWRLFLGVGLLGGFTTFSAFSAETALLLQQGKFGVAALYVSASVVCALVLLFAGLGLVRAAT
jgi:CrcB protein